MERHFKKKRAGEAQAGGLFATATAGSKRPRQLRLNELKKVVNKQDVLDQKAAIENACRVLVKMDVGLLDEDDLGGDSPAAGDVEEEEDDDDDEEEEEWGGPGDSRGKDAQAAQAASSSKNENSNSNSSSSRRRRRRRNGASRREQRQRFEERNVRSALDVLSGLFISFETLKSSGVGKVVNKLCMQPALSGSYSLPEDVVACAASLVAKWKATAMEGKARRERMKRFRQGDALE